MSRLVPDGRRTRVTADGTTVLHESAPGGMRKMRCPNSHQLATPAQQKDGSSILRTPGGSAYRTVRLK